MKGNVGHDKEAQKYWLITVSQDRVKKAIIDSERQPDKKKPDDRDGMLR